MNIGEQIGPYRIESLLGKGGMAEVYKAFHTGLHRYEALKVLPPQTTSDRSFVERFLREARIAANLQHPHIATIHSVSDIDSAQPYFTMELVESGDLSDFVAARAPMNLDEALPILTQIASALDYAHAQGVLHRDIKPGNILLKPDGNGGFDVKVVDFGIARAQEDNSSTRLTKTGMIVGTPEYMSPEQCGSGAALDARTDQYSLGILVYEMMCGTPPFKAQNDIGPISLIMQHVRDEPRAPVAHNPQISKATNNAILKSLAKQPEERFASCGEFAATLAGSNVVEPPDFGDELHSTSIKKRLTAPFIIGAAALTGVVLISLGLNNNLKAPPPVPTPVASVPSLVPVKAKPTIKPTIAKIDTESHASQAGVLSSKQIVGPFRVKLTIDPAIARVGDAIFTAKVLRDGKPVENAKVILKLSMSTMAMAGPEETLQHAGGDMYQGKANLGMGGNWQADIIIRTETESGTAVFEFAVTQE